MIGRAVAVLVIDGPAAIACSALSWASGSRSRVLLPVCWCHCLLILKPERWRAYDPSPVGRLCGRNEDDLYCIAAYPFDHVGDSAIYTTRVVPDSGDYLERYGRPPWLPSWRSQIIERTGRH